LRLSITSEYAIQAMLYLSEVPLGESVRISSISESREIPESLLRKIMAQLRRSGLIFTIRGKGGGVQLAKSANSISLLDIIESIEGKIFLNKCLISTDICSRTYICGVHNVWRSVQDQMKETLNKSNLASLVQEETILKRNYNLGGTR
jgi:Rrf2 family protein|tara:strand:+ start:1292 stop:1735 length:444 start_codon:yes stop_codon:yes gene_type:complete